MVDFFLSSLICNTARAVPMSISTELNFPRGGGYEAARVEIDVIPPPLPSPSCHDNLPVSPLNPLWKPPFYVFITLI